jgi:predicted membrane-bound mannosyltransferase
MKRRIGGFIDQWNIKAKTENQSFATFEAYCNFIRVVMLANEKESVFYVEKAESLPSAAIKLSAILHDK